jgi:hypothetical protein
LPRIAPNAPETAPPLRPPSPTARLAARTPPSARDARRAGCDHGETAQVALSGTRAVRSEGGSGSPARRAHGRRGRSSPGTRGRSRRSGAGGRPCRPGAWQRGPVKPGPGNPAAAPAVS